MIVDLSFIKQALFEPKIKGRIVSPFTRNPNSWILLRFSKVRKEENLFATYNNLKEYDKIGNSLNILPLN